MCPQFATLWPLCVLNLHLIFLQKHVVRNPGLCREAYFTPSVDTAYVVMLKEKMYPYVHFGVPGILLSLTVGSEGHSSFMFSPPRVHFVFLLMHGGQWAGSRTW